MTKETAHAGVMLVSRSCQLKDVMPGGAGSMAERQNGKATEAVPLR